VHLSEAGLNRARVNVEIEWLIHLANRNLLKTNAPLDLTEVELLREVVSNFSDADVETDRKSTRLNSSHIDRQS
jgi:adenylosuccinate lyase